MEFSNIFNIFKKNIFIIFIPPLVISIIIYFSIVKQIDVSQIKHNYFVIPINKHINIKENYSNVLDKYSEQIRPLIEFQNSLEYLVKKIDQLQSDFNYTEPVAVDWDSTSKYYFEILRQLDANKSISQEEIKKDKILNSKIDLDLIKKLPPISFDQNLESRVVYFDLKKPFKAIIHPEFFVSEKDSESILNYMKYILDSANIKYSEKIKREFIENYINEFAYRYAKIIDSIEQTIYLHEEKIIAKKTLLSSAYKKSNQNNISSTFFKGQVYQLLEHLNELSVANDMNYLILRKIKSLYDDYALDKEKFIKENTLDFFTFTYAADNLITNTEVFRNHNVLKYLHYFIFLFLTSIIILLLLIYDQKKSN